MLEMSYTSLMLSESRKGNIGTEQMYPTLEKNQRKSRKIIAVYEVLPMD